MFFSWLIILLVWLAVGLVFKMGTPPLVGWLLLFPFFFQDIYDARRKSSVNVKIRTGNPKGEEEDLDADEEREYAEWRRNL